MSWRWRLGGLLVVLAVLLPVLAGAGPDSVDAYQNARQLQKWKADPEHYARLQRDQMAFHALPAERQEHLRQFDRELYALDARTRRRLWEVLQRYDAWLNDPQMSESDRMQIEMAGNVEEKLQMIRRIRDLQWVNRAPQKVRDERCEVLKKLPEAEREAQVSRWRQDEHQRRKRMSDQIKNTRPK